MGVGLAWVGYFVLIGGSEAGLLPLLRVVNALMGITAVVIWIALLRRGSDVVDQLIVLLAAILPPAECNFSG